MLLARRQRPVPTPMSLRGALAASLRRVTRRMRVRPDRPAALTPSRTCESNVRPRALCPHGSHQSMRVHCPGVSEVGAPPPESASRSEGAADYNIAGVYPTRPVATSSHRPEHPTPASVQRCRGCWARIESIDSRAIRPIALFSMNSTDQPRAFLSVWPSGSCAVRSRVNTSEVILHARLDQSFTLSLSLGSLRHYPLCWCGVSWRDGYLRLALVCEAAIAL
jgi:hypothetical protein